MPTIEHDGRRIDYEEAGAGPRLLLLPPGASPAAAWRPVMERLADRFRLVAVNFSGYGGTERLGDDVPLTGENGAILLIKDYFVLDAPPTLLSPAGAMMPPDLVSKPVGPRAPGQYPQAATPEGAEPIGKVETLSGTAQVTRADGVTVQLSHPSVSESRVDEFFQ